MRIVAVLLLFACRASATDISEQQRGAALAKVVSMLSDMMAKAKTEKQDEKVRFAAFKQFCEMTTKEKETAMADGANLIEKLKADIGDANADAAQMAKDIGSLNADISSWESETKEANTLRKAGAERYQKAHDEYEESIDSVERAIETVKAGPGAAAALAQTSLLELNSKSLVPAKTKRLITSLLQKWDAKTALLQDGAEMLMDAEATAPEAHVFESQSGGVMQIVEDLGDKFSAEKNELEKREMNEKSAHEMMVADLTDQIEGATKERNKKTAFKAQREQESADASGDLADATKTLAEDTKYHSDLTAECEGKSVDFKQRQTTRGEEIEAINKAIQIMSSEDVMGGAQHLSLAQTKAKTALLQLTSSSGSPAQGIAANFLKDRASRTKSQVLSFLATKVSDEPFKKVIKMVKDMIAKLMQEAQEEAEHKGFCDTEMSTNKMTRDQKTEEVASLKAEVEELTANIAQLTEDIANLGKAIAESDAAVAKATTLREEEKAKNTATLADAKVAQDATSQALQVLKDFYTKAASLTAASAESKVEGPISYDKRALAILESAKGGAAMVQIPGGPEMEGGAYNGMEAGGPLGMLETIISDFATLIAETNAAETDAQNEFEEFSADSAQDKAVKTADTENKSAEKTDKETALASAKKDMKGSLVELAAANEYWEKLKPSCELPVVSYEERTAKRKEEIESLQEALKILQPNSM
jgi:chromosome segregation ATPase